VANPLRYVDARGEQATLGWCFGGPVPCVLGVCTAVATYYGVKGTMSAIANNGSGSSSDGGSSVPISTPCPDTNTCSAKDPCKGLRDILKEHEDKLRNYINDPLGNDNRGILGAAYLANNGAIAQSIYDGRIAELQKQIRNFKKQLEECEQANGKK
jgi:hypothetical protein